MTVYYEIYNPQGVLVESGVMGEEVAGVYLRDVTFKSEWGTGVLLSALLERRGRHRGCDDCLGG